MSTLPIGSPPSSPLLAGGFWTRIGRSSAFFAVLLLGVLTGFVALLEGVGSLPLPFNLYEVDRALPVIFRLHMLASGAVLVLIPCVMLMRSRPRWHRPLGRAAGVLVILGGLSSFPVAFASTSPVVARLGFGAQGVVWIGLLVAGVAAARSRRLLDHRRTMTAMAAVASGAIWTRLATAVITSSHLPFDAYYSAAAWLGWLAPMALVLAVLPSQRPRGLRVT